MWLDQQQSCQERATASITLPRHMSRSRRDDSGHGTTSTSVSTRTAGFFRRRRRSQNALRTRRSHHRTMSGKMHATNQQKFSKYKKILLEFK